MREIFCSKARLPIQNIKQSEDLGIVIIHQELALIPYLSIAENIYLGNERAEKGIMNWNETMIGAKERWIRWDSAKTRTRRSADWRRQAAARRNREGLIEEGEVLILTNRRRRSTRTTARTCLS